MFDFRRARLGIRLGRLLIAGVLAVLPSNWAAGAATDAAPESRKSVLVLHVEQPHYPWVAGVSAGLYSVLDAEPPSRRPDVATDFLALGGSAGRAEAQRAWFRERYRGQRFDVIVAVTNPALAFLEPLREELWPEAALILLTPRRSLEGFRLPAGVIAVQARFEIEKTLDLAKSLLPGIRHVAYVAEDSSENARLQRDLAARGLDLIDLTGLRIEELEKRIATLPEDTVVFFLSFESDPSGRRFIPREVLKRVSALSSSPIVSVSATMMGYGLLGGSVLDYTELGAETGRVVLRVLAGEPVAQIPEAPSTFSRLMLDDRELRRWGIPASRVPAGSQILFRKTTPWAQFPRTTAAILAALLVQAALIAALVVERRRRSEARALTGAALASFPGQVAVLDGKGNIVHVNENWVAFGGAHGAGPAGGLSLGSSYLETWRLALRSGDPHAGNALDLIESVLLNSRKQGSLEYASHGPEGERWYDMHVQVLDGRHSGAVIALLDVTKRHQADDEARQLQAEIAHLNRVASVGELASSLAHELNQPLAAILVNAQAARRLVAEGPPASEDLRECLKDIVEDDQRAGDVIQRMRSLLRKGEARRDSVELNHVVRSVVRLVSSEAVLRRVAIETELAPELPAISGDGVQLQQVVLNLVLNGLDAAGERPVGQRQVQVRTVSSDSRVELTVLDSGSGIPGGSLSRIFEPFFTTKSKGLGIGLSICRSIVEAHAGRITASSRQGQGAAFECVFPAAAAGAS